MENVASLTELGEGGRRLLALVDAERLARILERMLDEAQFLSPYGLRSLSKEHEAHPFVISLDGHTQSVHYEPGESTSGLFGGNSNWRGPIWFPVNYLMIESLQKFHHYYGDSVQVELPTGSGRRTSLDLVASDLCQRLIRLFLPQANGSRPFQGPHAHLLQGSDGLDPLLFHEYFHGDTGAGLGASHQTGWTALVARMIQEERRHQG